MQVVHCHTRKVGDGGGKKGGLDSPVERRSGKSERLVFVHGEVVGPVPS